MQPIPMASKIKKLSKLFLHTKKFLGFEPLEQIMSKKRDLITLEMSCTSTSTMIKTAKQIPKN